MLKEDVKTVIGVLISHCQVSWLESIYLIDYAAGTLFY